MGKNTKEGYSIGSVKGREQFTNPKTGLATKRDTETGRFIEVKKGGGNFKGVAEAEDKRLSYNKK